MSAAKYALVTGGNRGLGLEVAKLLVAKGKPLIITARNAAQGQSVAESLVKDAPDSSAAVVKCLTLDASDANSIQELAATVKKDYDQQVDLLINNAGILVRGEWSKEVFDSTFTTNTKGPIAISQALLPHLAQDALIVMVSSGLGQTANLTSDYKDAIQSAASLETLQALAFNPASPMGTSAPASGSMTPTYTVAKAALNRAVQLLADDSAFKARGIRLASVCPGWCRTDMGGAEADRSAEQGASSILWPWLNWSASAQASFTRDGTAVAW